MIGRLVPVRMRVPGLAPMTMRLARVAMRLALAMGVLALAAPPCLASDPASTARPGPKATLAMVITHAPDTPNGKPYLALAVDNAEQARDALRNVLRPGADASAVGEGVRAALKLLDPQYGGSSPGQAQGYGVRQALARTVEGLHAASQATPANETLAAALACASAAQSSIDETVDLGRAALVGASSRVAWQGARAMAMALDHAIDGWDRDGDGVIKWQRGEGGLTAAAEFTRALAGAQSAH